MSIMPDPPTGVSHHHKGLDSGLRAGGPGAAAYEMALLNSVAFERHFFDFGEATMPVDQVGAAGFFQYEESGAETDYVKITPTAARPSHIMADIISASGGCSLVTVAQFLSEQNPWLEVAFDLEAVTVTELTIGFCDPAAAAAGDILDDIDTPSFAAEITDGAVIGLDTAQTLGTAALVCRNNSDTTKVDVAPVAAPYGIPTAATQVVYRIELRGQKAYAFINGILVATGGDTAGPRAGTLLEAVILVSALDGTDKEVHIDYIDVGQERVNQPF